jgi:hypothetical protein
VIASDELEMIEKEAGLTYLRVLSRQSPGRFVEIKRTLDLDSGCPGRYSNWAPRECMPREPSCSVAHVSEPYSAGHWFGLAHGCCSFLIRYKFVK